MATATNANDKAYKCHDCQKELKVVNEEIENGVMAVYEYNGEKVAAVKCADCFEQNPGLQNYQECEVYSRIVGYLRPVRQWNRGKQEEYSERKEYKIS